MCTEFWSRRALGFSGCLSVVALLEEQAPACDITGMGAVEAHVSRAGEYWLRCANATTVWRRRWSGDGYRVCGQQLGEMSGYVAGVSVYKAVIMN